MFYITDMKEIDRLAKKLPILIWHIKTSRDVDPCGHWSIKPDHLVPLIDANWPKDVVDVIVEVSKALGFQDPLTQKIVEPYATVFGGRRVKGEPDFSRVDWELAKLYFRWEAAQWREEKGENEAFEMEKEAKKRYGFIFAVKPVYEKHFAD